VSEPLAWAVFPATRPGAGGGHVARCTALSAALGEYGPVTVIIEPGGGLWEQHFAALGLETVCEPVTDRSFAGIVLDNYALDAGDVARWRTSTQGPLVQIDDFGCPLSGVDLAINATPGLHGDILEGVPALLGARYAMLGAPYTGVTSREISPEIERVVVGIGLDDSNDATGLALQAIELAMSGKCCVDVILGSISVNAGTIREMTEARSNWNLYLDADEPWRLAMQADLAITGGGQSLLERLALGIPSIGIAIADNQAPALAGAEAAGAIVNMGPLADLSVDMLSSSIRNLARDRKRRALLASSGQQLVDGHGAARTAAHLNKLVCPEHFQRQEKA